MKLFFMTVIAFIMLSGGGGSSYMYMAIAPANASASEAKSAAGGNHFEYVELAPLILPIIDEYGLSQMVSIVVSLEVADAANAAEIERMQPRLTDAYLQDMYGVLHRQAAIKNGVIQVSTLKKRLNKVSNKVMGDGVVHDVLLQVVQQRPM